jgi:hypothetical protein
MKKKGGVLGRLRQEVHKFEASLGCIVRTCLEEEEEEEELLGA